MGARKKYERKTEGGEKKLSMQLSGPFPSSLPTFILPPPSLGPKDNKPITGA